ncbi:MAG: hypothetical protein E5299_02387 [Burkholderia gladioli]|nr:MAG: hypothetical protein E5299_02387 [Burkholderia gladioli]
MRKDIHKTGKPKTRYRVRNWAAYNAGLINRGNVTIWIDEAVLAKIPEMPYPHVVTRVYTAIR